MVDMYRTILATVTLGLLASITACTPKETQEQFIVRMAKSSCIEQESSYTPAMDVPTTVMDYDPASATKWSTRIVVHQYPAIVTLRYSCYNALQTYSYYEE